jgi:hypothetical protein
MCLLAWSYQDSRRANSLTLARGSSTRHLDVLVGEPDGMT